MDSVGPAFCAFPGLNSSGSQELDGCSLPECSEPYPLHGPSLSLHAPVGCKWLVSVLRSWILAVTLQPQPSRWMSTIQNLRKSLVRDWRPVCSLVGGAVSGAEFAPFPSPLPSDSSGDGPVHSRLALLWNCSVPLFCKWPAVCSGRLIFSLSCYPTV